MVRIVLPAFVRTFNGLTIVVLALSISAGAQELGQLYDLNETVSVEADVRNFIWGEPTARIVIAPLDKTKAGPNGMIAVVWHPTPPLSQQGIPMYWLKPNERVVVTGHPRRPLRPGTKSDGSLLLKTITRPSDGWKWPGGPPPSAKPTAESSSSNGSGAAATVSKPAPMAQPPEAAAAAVPTAPKPSNPQNTDSRGAAQAQIDKQVAAGTTAVTDELHRKSQQALEQARVETLCTQRAYKVSADPTNAGHQQALAACRAENGQPGAGGAATAAAQVPAVNGTYVGTYQCAQGATRLKVEIDQRNPPLLTALFTFYPGTRIPGTNSDSFSYQLEGQYESSSDTRLTPIRWTSTPPPGYTMVGMVGRLEPQAGTFDGRIEGAGCTTFTLSRNPIKVAEFASVVSRRPVQSQAPRPASPQVATVPPAGTTRPAPPATPSTAARATTAAPPKTLEFESSDFDALSKAVKGGAQGVTVRGTITRITDMEMGAALKDVPALYFEGERVLVGPINGSLSAQIDAKFGKNGLVGKRVAIVSPAAGVRADGRSILLMIHSADDIRVESTSAAQPSGSAPAPSIGARSQSAGAQPPQPIPSTPNPATDSPAAKPLEFSSDDVAGLRAMQGKRVTILVRGTIARVDAGAYYFQGDRIAIGANPTVRAHLAKLMGKRVAITTNFVLARSQDQVLLVVQNVDDVRVE